MTTSNDQENTNNDSRHSNDVMEIVAPLRGENTCHVLPCDINFTGMAPTHLYFHPVQIEPGICASSFRGRGLLANNSTKYSSMMTRTATASEISNSNNNRETDDHDYELEPITTKSCLLSIEQNQIHIKVSIDNILEWQVFVLLSY
jgi:hypothetical protein